MIKVRAWLTTAFMALAVGSTALASGPIYFGVWSQGWPSGPWETASEFYDVMVNDFNFNLIIGSVPPDRASYLAQDSLYAVGQNITVEGLSPYPEMYAHTSTYMIFYAKGQPYTTWRCPYDRRLHFNGGDYVLPDSARRFRAGVDASGLIQHGPYVKQVAGYLNGPWNSQDPRYSANWIFKVGADPNPSLNDTIAVLKVIYGDCNVAEGCHETDTCSWTTLDSLILTDDLVPYYAQQLYATASVFYNFSEHPSAEDRNTDSLVQFVVDWRGARNLIIREVKVHDLYGRDLVEFPNFARDLISEYYASFTGTALSQIHQWHLAEENNVLNQSGFIPIRVVDSLCGTLDPVIPAYAIITDTTIANFIGLESWELMQYPFLGSACNLQPTSFSSDYALGDSVNLQTRLDEVVASYSLWNSWAKPKGKNVTASLQSFVAPVFRDSGSFLYDYWRRPTAREMLVEVNLALCHDIRQLTFWKYASGVSPFKCEESDTLSRTRALNGFISDSLRDSTIYFAVKDTVSPAVAALIPHLEPLDWQGASLWNEVRGETFSFVDTVHSSSFPSAPYIQTAFYKDETGYDYILLVNRRCLLSESQTVGVLVKYNEPPFNTDPGHWLITQDMVTGFTDTTQYGFGTVIPPGGAKLIKVTPLVASFGVLASNLSVEADDSPFYIIGDLEICPSCTLSIGPGVEVRIAAASDYTASGIDSTKTEIIVKGVLQIEGSSSQKVRFAPSATPGGFNDWRGIRVEPGGAVTAEFASIKHAYSALEIAGSSECLIQSCEFDSCMMYGVKSSNPNLDIRLSKFQRISDGYGIHVTDSCTIYGNSFGENSNHMPTGIMAIASNAAIDSNVFHGSLGTNQLICGIAVSGKKSSWQPLKITRASMSSPQYGIDIAVNSNVQVDDCELLGALCKDCFDYYGIIERARTTTTVVSNTLIQGFRTGVSSYMGTLDLGTWDGEKGGRNTIYPDCPSDTAGEPCWYYDDYQYVSSNAISGTFKAEDNHWTWPCSTNTAPPSSRIPDILDYSPLGTFNGPTACQSGGGGGGESKLTTNVLVPISFGLDQNQPNPFNPSTVISYSISTPAYVQLEVYNILGQCVATLVDEYRQPGWYRVRWDGRLSNGREAATGVYFYRLRAGEFESTKKMLLVK